MKQTRTLVYNFRWEIAKVVNNPKHVAQLQIEATIFKGGHTAQIQQLRVSHIPVFATNLQHKFLDILRRINIFKQVVVPDLGCILCVRSD